MSSGSGAADDQNRDHKRDRTRRRSRREIDRAIDDLAGNGPTPDRTESWRRYISLDLDPDDPLHRLWITAGAEGDMTDADACRAIERFNEQANADAEPEPESEIGEIEQAARQRVRELDAERDREVDR